MTSEREHMEASVDEKFERYLRNKNAFTVNISEDVDLYLRANNWDDNFLKLKFLQDMRERPIETQCIFINAIPLDSAMDGRIGENIIVFYILDTLKFASTEVLRNMDINPAVSPIHSDLHECHQDMLNIRQSMCRMQSDYQPPHVAVSLTKSNVDFSFAKYFNGSKWCKLQLNEQIRSYVSALVPHKYTILGDDIWFIYDDTLFRMNLFRETNYNSFILPKHTFQDIQLCNDGESLILLSKSMWVAEIYPVKYSDYDFKVSTWYQLTPNEYCTTSTTKDYHLYNINLRKQRRMFKAYYIKSQEKVYEFFKGHLYGYRLDGNRFAEKNCEIVIPKCYEYNDMYCIVPKETIQHYLFKLFKNDPHSKRKHIDCSNDILPKGSCKKKRVLTVRYQTDNGNADEYGEALDFEQLTI